MSQLQGARRRKLKVWVPGCACRLFSSANAGLLEKLRAMPAVVERKLGDAISVPVYASHAASLRVAGDTVKDRGLYAGAAHPHSKWKFKLR